MEWRGRYDDKRKDKLMGLPAFAYDSYEPITCGECGLIFCVPSGWADARREDHRSLWCPNGHCRAYGESAKERELRAKSTEIERLKKQLEWKEKSLKSVNQMVDSAHRSNAALRGVIAKEQKRVGNGVCPCCNRTFTKLGQHMQTKHPGWKESEPRELEHS